MFIVLVMLSWCVLLLRSQLIAHSANYSIECMSGHFIQRPQATDLVAPRLKAARPLWGTHHSSLFVAEAPPSRGRCCGKHTHCSATALLEGLPPPTSSAQAQRLSPGTSDGTTTSIPALPCSPSSKRIPFLHHIHCYALPLASLRLFHPSLFNLYPGACLCLVSCLSHCCHYSFPKVPVPHRLPLLTTSPSTSSLVLWFGHFGSFFDLVQQSPGLTAA
jgi:hypothetical protein